jgi:hypothetical protein
MLSFLKPVVQAFAPELRAKYRSLELATELGLETGGQNRDHFVHAQIQSETSALCRNGDFSSFQTAYERAFSSKERCASGHRVYAQMEGGLSDLIGSAPRINEAFCERVRDAWDESGRTPFMGAVYGFMLFNTGYSWRGESDARSVSGEGWAKHRYFTEQAHDAFFHVEPRASECAIWHRLYRQIGISDGSSPQEMARRYDRAIAFDSLDIWAPLGRAWELLPRWHGSYEEIELFAAKTAQRTANDYGEAMYARIYAHIGEAYGEDIRDTIVDHERLCEGYRDWFAQTQSQFAANKHASAAFMVGDNAQLLDVVTKSMKQFQPDCWPSPIHSAEALEYVLKNKPISAAPPTTRLPPSPPTPRGQPAAPRPARIFGKRNSG